MASKGDLLNPFDAQSPPNPEEIHRIQHDLNAT